MSLQILFVGSWYQGSLFLRTPPENQAQAVITSQNSSDYKNLLMPPKFWDEKNINLSLM